MRAVVYDRYGPAEVLRIEGGRAAGPRGERGARERPRDHGHPLGLRIPRRRPVLLPPLHRPPAAEAAHRGDGARRRRRGGRLGRDRVRGRGRGLRAPLGRERRVRLRPRAGRARAQAGGPEPRGGRSALRRREHRARAWRRPISAREAHRRLRRVGVRSGPPASSSRRQPARTSRPCATRRTSTSCARSARTWSSTTRRRTSRRRARRTTSSSTPSASTSFRRCRRSLKPGGVYVETDLGFLWHVPFLALATRWIGDKRVTLPIPKYTKEDVLHVKALVEAGKYRPVIDRDVPARGGRRGHEVRRDRPEDRERGAHGRRRRHGGGEGGRPRPLRPPEVLRIAEVDRPEPADDEVLVRVQATTVTRTDIHMRMAKPFIWRFLRASAPPQGTGSSVRSSPARLRASGRP